MERYLNTKEINYWEIHVSLNKIQYRIKESSIKELAAIPVRCSGIKKKKLIFKSYIRFFQYFTLEEKTTYFLPHVPNRLNHGQGFC